MSSFDTVPAVSTVPLTVVRSNRGQGGVPQLSSQ